MTYFRFEIWQRNWILISIKVQIQSILNNFWWISIIFLIKFVKFWLILIIFFYWNVDSKIKNVKIHQKWQNTLNFDWFHRFDQILNFLIKFVLFLMDFERFNWILVQFNWFHRDDADSNNKFGSKIWFQSDSNLIKTKLHFPSQFN